MSSARSVAVRVESLRTAALARRAALALDNQDVEEAGARDAWVSFRAAISATDAVLFATPEYNRSAPAPLKSALDVGSRRDAQSLCSGKPGPVVSVSPGALFDESGNLAKACTRTFLGSFMEAFAKWIEAVLP